MNPFPDRSTLIELPYPTWSRHLRKDHTSRKDIGARVELLTLRLLRRQVRTLITP